MPINKCRDFTPPTRLPSSSTNAFATLPKEVLTSIATAVKDDPAVSTPLLDLALVCKALYSAVLPVLYRNIIIEGAAQVVMVAKALKGAVTSRNDKGAGIATLASSLRTLLLSVSPSSLSFELSLGSSSAHQPLQHLFPPASSALFQLSHLTSFQLDGELWLHDLLPLLTAWPSLRSLELSHLRGDCSTPLSPVSSHPPQLTKLVLRKSTLTGTMIAFLLATQNELKHLEMPLPGGNEGEGKRAWEAIEKLSAKGLEVLRVWDRWTQATSAATKRTQLAQKQKATSTFPLEAGKGRRGSNDELDRAARDDFEEEPASSPLARPSPLLRVLVKSTSLRSLLLVKSYLPSAPASDSFDSLVPYLEGLEQLLIEDTPAAGLRAAVQGALRAGEMENLKEVVSFGTKMKGVIKKKQDEKEDAKKEKQRKGKGEQQFENACEKRGVRWTSSEASIW
ncbi:hypothetical protein JCM1840_006128 [Sporobolomyces johnsonii]